MENTKRLSWFSLNVANVGSAIKESLESWVISEVCPAFGNKKTSPVLGLNINNSVVKSNERKGKLGHHQEHSSWLEMKWRCGESKKVQNNLEILKRTLSMSFNKHTPICIRHMSPEYVFVVDVIDRFISERAVSVEVSVLAGVVCFDVGYLLSGSRPWGQLGCLPPHHAPHRVWRWRQAGQDLEDEW